MKILLLILFTLAATASTRSTNSSKALDITTLLNNTIAKNFQNMDSETICSFIRSMELLNSTTSFGDSFPGVFYYFTGLKVESASLCHEFYSKTMTIFFTSLSTEMRGYLGPTPDTSNENFALSLNFKNISIYVIAGPQYGLCDNEFFQYIDFESYESNYIYSPRFYENSTPEVQHELETLIKSISPSLFQFNLRKNEDFMQILNATFCQDPEDEITSHYPSLDIVETKCYFFIPNVTSLDRILSNITIIGMHNFDSHSFVDVSTLIIEDIQGTTNLHYDGRNFTIFPLHFEIGHISISVDREQQSINVTAHNYTVIDRKMKVSLTKYQSKWVMEGIQLAIASSIMPSLKYYRNRNNTTNSLEEHPLAKISTKISQQFKASKIRNLYDAWNITIPESFKTESSIQIESHTYNISIHAQPTTALKPYPNSIECSLYNYLEFHFILPCWSGKISMLNTTHEFNEIDFKMSNIFVAIYKQNNSNVFELRSGPIFNASLQLVSNPYDFTDHERFKIAQKAQELLISWIEKTAIFFLQPLLSLPLDYCTAPVKIFDDFLPFYADHELPFHVPDGRFANEYTETNINNVIITRWTKSPTAFISLCHFNGSATLSTYIDLELSEAKIRMNFNGNDEPLDERHLTLCIFDVRIYTDIAVIAVYLHFRPLDYIPSPENNYTILFRNESEIHPIEKKLQRMLGECFTNFTSPVF